MEIKIYDSFSGLEKLHDNKLSVIIFGSKLSNKEYHLKTLFLDLYGADFDTYPKAEDVSNHLKGLYQEYMDNFYSTHGLSFKLTGSKKLHVCFGTEKVLEELEKRVRIKKVELSDILYIRDGNWDLDNFSSIKDAEINKIRKYIN